MAFKDKLKDLRQSKNITQDELAKTIYVSRSAIAKWESGLGIPSDTNLKALCEFFEIEENRILDRNDLIEEIKVIKLQKRNIVVALLGIIFPIIFISFSFASLYHYHPDGTYILFPFYPPTSMMNFLGRLWQVLAYLVWGATVIASVLSLSVVQYKKFTAYCFRTNLAMLILSLLIFVVLFTCSIFLAENMGFRLIVL